MNQNLQNIFIKGLLKSKKVSSSTYLHEKRKHSFNTENGRLHQDEELKQSNSTKVKALKSRIKQYLGAVDQKKETGKSKSISKKNSPNSSVSKPTEENSIRKKLKLYSSELEKMKELHRQNKLLKENLEELAKSTKEGSTTNDSSKDLQKDNTRLKNTVISLKCSIKQSQGKEQAFQNVLEELKKRGIDLLALLSKEGESESASQRIKNTSRFFADESLIFESAESSFNYMGKSEASEEENKNTEAIPIPGKLRAKLKLDLQEITEKRKQKSKKKMSKLK